MSIPQKSDDWSGIFLKTRNAILSSLPYKAMEYTFLFPNFCPRKIASSSSNGRDGGNSTQLFHKRRFILARCEVIMIPQLLVCLRGLFFFTGNNVLLSRIGLNASVRKRKVFSLCVSLTLNTTAANFFVPYFCRQTQFATKLGVSRKK